MFLKIKSDKVFLPMSFMNYSDFKKQGDYSLIQQTPTEFGQWIGRLSRNSPSRQIQLKLPWELFERAAELGLAKAAGVSRAEREGGIPDGVGCVWATGSQGTLDGNYTIFLPIFLWVILATPNAHPVLTKYPQ